MKIFKKTLAMVLSIVMVFGVMPASVFTASAADASACPIEGATGTGTETDPIIVDTFEELNSALKYSEDLHILVENGTYIECTEPLKVIGTKNLTVNGTLHGQETVLQAYILGNANEQRVIFVLQGDGEIHSENGYAYVHHTSYNPTNIKPETLIRGNLTFMSEENDSVYVYADGLTIEGGTFKTNNSEHLSMYLDGRSGALDISLAGGSYPNGIDRRNSSVKIKEGYAYQYADGSISSTLQINVPVEVVNTDYNFGFATQTPSVMPEGKTEHFLGNYTVGTEAAKFTFGFSVVPLSSILKKAGYSTTEELTVVSAKNGIINNQKSGAEYTIDNTVVDTYTIIETITYSDGNGVLIDTITHSFIVSIQPEGYVTDTDCPIEGATGSGTEADPIVVDTFMELNSALKYSEDLHILVENGTYIECTEPLKVIGTKNLTVNGTLHGQETVLQAYVVEEAHEKRVIFVLQGDGEIHSENGYAYVHHTSYNPTNIKPETLIRGNLTFMSEENDSVYVYADGLTIEGGTFKTNNSEHLSMYLDGRSGALDISLAGGSYPNGIDRRNSSVKIKEGYFYCYDDGTVSTTFKTVTPVEIYSLGFATQTPAMPEGQTTADFDEVFENGKTSELTFSFTSKPLPFPQESIKAGYSIVEEMTVYSEKQGKVIHTQSNGNAYTIDESVLDTYTVTETIKLVKDGEAIATLTHTFNGDVNIRDWIDFENQTPAVSEEESQNGSKDLGTFIPYLFDGKFSFTPYISEALVNKGYHILTTTLLRKNGTQVYFNSGDTKDDVSSYITGYGDYQFMQKINLYDSENNFIDSVYFSYYFTVEDLRNTFGFTSHSPELSAEDAFDGRTDLGVIFEAPSFSYTARDISDEMKAAGYNLVFKTTVYHTDTAVQESDDPYSWTCGVYDYGTKTVRQSLMLYAPNGTLVSAWHHTYTFTYLPLKFYSRTPSVSTAEAAAGVSNLGTLTTAQTFSFSAMPLDFTLKEEGYSTALKTEAYQGDKLVYTADNGDSYIHIYQGEGKVVQTIYILNADGEVVGSKSHTYNFTMDFPDGTITLDSDYLTIAEGSSQAITATVIPESLANTLVWTSSNPSIAKVDKNGTVTAVRAGSAIITAALGNGATAYCPVLVTASDVKAYVGGVGLAEGEYLVWGNYAPTTVKPSDHYAYLATVNGTLKLTLHNYSYSGEGTFISKNAAYGIYSSSALKIVAEGENRIGAMSAPLERYTSYGIGSASTVSFSSDSSSFLTIRGVSTGISSLNYVSVSGNLNIENAASGISCTNAQSMGSISFNSGNVNIDCTGTAITITGNAINFAGANVNINCKNGINLVRQGTILVDGGSLEMYASASGINVKSGQTMTVESGTVYIEAANNGIALAGALTVNDGSMVVKSTDTASDSTYSALNGTGTVTLSSNVKAFASTQSTAESTVTFNSANMGNYDYVLFEGSLHEFVKQPVGGEIASTEKMTVTWETGFVPLKIELVTYDGTSLSYTTLDAAATSAELGALPEGGYYQIKANYSASHYVTSERFYITTKTHTVIFGYGLTAQYQYVKDGECAVKPADPTSSGYFFAGWWTEEGEPYDFSTPVTGRLTLVPRWSEVKLNGVAIPNGSYLGQHSGAVTTGKPSDHWAYYKDGVLTLYNFDSSYGAGIEFGEIDLTVVSSGNGNAVSCIVSDYDYANLTIDGTAQLNVGHSQWMYSAIQVYDTITFKCDTVVECIDAMAIPDVLTVIVDDCDVSVYAYADMGNPRTIYGYEASIKVTGDGSLYLCYGADIEALTDSYVINPDYVTVYANTGNDGNFTDDDIITQVSDAYDLMAYNQVLIKHKHITVVREGVDPTCKTTGIADYYECVCGRFYSDAECTKEITDLEAWKSGEGVLPVSDHNWTNLDGVCAFGCGTKAFETKNGAIIDNASGYIYGLDAGITSVDSYFNVLVDGAEWVYELGQFGGFGTGTKATLKKGDTTVAEYTILIYGDLNGDGWYDGEDAFLVNLIVKGMLKQADLPDYMWKAADCNHDGVINEADVDLLMGAGLKLNSVDQNKAVSDLLSNSDYIEYAMLIDQSAGMSVEPDIDNSQQGITTPETNETVEPDEPAEDSYFGIFISKVFLFIHKIFNFVFSFVIK